MKRFFYVLIMLVVSMAGLLEAAKTPKLAKEAYKKFKMSKNLSVESNGSNFPRSYGNGSMVKPTYYSTRPDLNTFEKSSSDMSLTPEESKMLKQAMEGEPVEEADYVTPKIAKRPHLTMRSNPFLSNNRTLLTMKTIKAKEALQKRGYAYKSGSLYEKSPELKYYFDLLSKAKKEGDFNKVFHDELKKVHTDLGGSKDKATALTAAKDIVLKGQSYEEGTQYTQEESRQDDYANRRQNNQSSSSNNENTNNRYNQQQKNQEQSNRYNQQQNNQERYGKSRRTLLEQLKELWNEMARRSQERAWKRKQEQEQKEQKMRGNRDYFYKKSWWGSFEAERTPNNARFRLEINNNFIYAVLAGLGALYAIKKYLKEAPLVELEDGTVLYINPTYAWSFGTKSAEDVEIMARTLNNSSFKTHDGYKNIGSSVIPLLKRAQSAGAEKEAVGAAIKSDLDDCMMALKDGLYDPSTGKFDNDSQLALVYCTKLNKALTSTNADITKFLELKTWMETLNNDPAVFDQLVERVVNKNKGHSFW